MIWLTWNDMTDASHLNWVISRLAFSFCTLMKSIDCSRKCSNRLSSKCHLRIFVALCGPGWTCFYFNLIHFMSLALRLHRLPLTQAQYATACRLVLGLEYALQRGVAKEVCSILNLKALEYLKGWNMEQLLTDLESRKKRWFVHASRLQIRTWQTQRNATM